MTSKSKDDINFPLLGLLVVSGMIGLSITVIGVQAFYLYFTHRDFDSKWGNTPLKDVVAGKETQKAAVHRLEWVDKAHGVVAIPVEQAFMVLEQSGGKVPASRPSN